MRNDMLSLLEEVSRKGTEYSALSSKEGGGIGLCWAVLGQRGVKQVNCRGLEGEGFRILSGPHNGSFILGG